MVLYQEEYESVQEIYGKYLHYYETLPEYLHEMTAKDIMEHINRNGVISAMFQKTALCNYIKWLFDNHRADIDADKLSDLNYNLQMLISNDDGTYIGFYTLTELKQAIETKLQELESENLESPRNNDFNGLKAVFFLEWYGVPNDAAMSIKLTDVSDDGRTVYVPAEKRTVQIDDTAVATYFSEYKKRTGYKRYKNKDELPYTQNTFYRNTSDRPVTLKTFYNIKSIFQKINLDKRFEKKRVYNAGRYCEMLKIEQGSGKLFSGSNKWTQDIINRLFNKQCTVQLCNIILRSYRLYKQGYLENVSD